MCEYKIEEISTSEFLVKKDGNAAYVITRKIGPSTTSISCNCPSFKYRGTCKHVDLFKSQYGGSDPRIPRTIVEKFIEYWIKDIMKDLTDQWIPAGSYRRGSASCKDVDLVAYIPDLNKWKDLLSRILSKSELIKEKVMGSIIYRFDINYEGCIIPVDITRVGSRSCWASTILYRTGSKENNIRMRKMAVSKGMSLSEYGLYDLSLGEFINNEDWDEADYYETLGMRYLTPEQR